MNLITAFKSIFAAGEINLPRNAGQEIAWADDYGSYSPITPIYNSDDLVGKKGLAIYPKIMTDEQVKSVVRFRRSAITSRSYEFNFSDDISEQLNEDEQQFRKRLYTAVLREMPGSFNDALNGILSAYWNGFSLTEKVFNLFEYDGRSWVGLKKLALRPADTIEFYSDEHGNLLKMVQKVSDRDIELDPQKFIHYVQNPDVDEFYGRSELRECYRAWFSKDVAIKNQNIFGQRLAGGFTWAEVDEDYNIQPGSAEELKFKTVMQGIQTKSSIILPRGVTLHVETPKDANFFENKIAQEDKAIAKALLVPNLLGITEQGTTGSYSQSQTQFEAFMWTLDNDVNKLEEIINEQLLKELGDYNFGDGLYPHLKFKPLSQSAKMELAKLWLDYTKGGAISSSENDEDWIRDLLDAPVRQEVDPDEEGQVEGDPNEEKQNEDESDEDELEDETIIGESVQRISALSRAERRVDFVAIDRKADLVTNRGADLLSEAMDKAVASIVEKIPEEIDPKYASKIAIAPKDKQRIQIIIKNSLKDSWRIGQQQSEIEIKRAERQAKREFSRKVSMARLEDMAANYFDAQSFIVAGEVSDKATSIIKAEVMNGIRFSKTTAEITEAIYERLASAGVISGSTAEAANVGLDLKNTQHTLETVIRTNSFMSINEARHSYYTDPALDGFVTAFEYSSILDSRTTEICNHLGGAESGRPHTHASDWPGWDRYRPPNHYNCRALLIPVTELDEWEESPQPAIQPQEGFG